jgi:acetyltransferase-like isoleucine patch superfamily enzyme
MPIVHDWSEGTNLIIGAYTSIADDVHIFLGGHHRTDWISCFPFPAFIEEAKQVTEFGGTRGHVTIGNDVWLASGCTILSGVVVGDGAVVAARAVVARNVPPYAIVAGNPAKIIGWRFDEKTREALSASAWWLWPEGEVRQISPLLCSDKLDEFFAYVQRRDGGAGAKR